MKTYWKVLLSSFGALVPVIHRDQKFKSNSNDTAADRENLIWACKAPTFGTNHHTSSYLVLTTTKHSLRALEALKTPTLTSVDFSPSLYDIIKIIYKRRAVNTIRVLALSHWAVNTVQTLSITSQGSKYLELFFFVFKIFTSLEAKSPSIGEESSDVPNLTGTTPFWSKEL